VDLLVARIAVAFPVVREQLVDLARAMARRRSRSGWTWRLLGRTMRILGVRAMEDCKDLDILSVTTTVASPADALGLATRVLERRLAACGPGRGGADLAVPLAGQGLRGRGGAPDHQDLPDVPSACRPCSRNASLRASAVPRGRDAASPAMRSGPARRCSRAGGEPDPV
jgi:hypothetical protein